MHTPVHLFLNNKFYKTIGIPNPGIGRWFENSMPIIKIYDFIEELPTESMTHLVCFEFTCLRDKRKGLVQWIGNAVDFNVYIEKEQLIWRQ